MNKYWLWNLIEKAIKNCGKTQAHICAETIFTLESFDMLKHYGIGLSDKGVEEIAKATKTSVKYWKIRNDHFIRWRDYAR